jgi:16S rRNA (cytidine1402-2'-O)-methyltransferase
LDAHASPKDLGRVIERLQSGESLAATTDAGTPGVSDPAAALVTAARASGIQVVPIPGPSAVTALLSVSGFPETVFQFRGFFPRKPIDRKKEIHLTQGSSLSRVFVWFDSPERIEDSLETIASEAPDAEVVVGKELTKIHERFFSGLSRATFEQVQRELEREGKRGEWCFAVRFPEAVGLDSVKSAESSDWVKALSCLLDARVSASDAAKQVSQHFGVPRKIVYQTLLKISGKKITEGG